MAKEILSFSGLATLLGTTKIHSNRIHEFCDFFQDTGYVFSQEEGQVEALRATLKSIAARRSKENPQNESQKRVKRVGKEELGA